ncbi:radical s-adenosyl methionine domain-containing protein 2 [Fusarium oxysporum f. sp. phaseoli]
MALLSILGGLHLFYRFVILVIGVLGIGWIIISREQSKTVVARHSSKELTRESNVPVSVNYFTSRKCNYTCGFCFHTDTSSYVLPLNIAGGEPVLYPRLQTELLQFVKEELGLESISVVSNGSKITEKLMRENFQWLGILPISCDSFNPETNKKIGRGDDGGNLIRLFRIGHWCRDYGTKFKLNTVVNIHNWNKDMPAEIERLTPFRWKVVQCLLVAGEMRGPPS